MTEEERLKKFEREAWAKEFIERLAAVDKARVAYRRMLERLANGVVISTADVAAAKTLLAETAPGSTYVPGDEADKLRKELADARSAFEVERGRYSALQRVLAGVEEELHKTRELHDKLKEQCLEAIQRMDEIETERDEAYALLRRMGDGPRAIGRHAPAINFLLDEAWKKANKR